MTENGQNGTTKMHNERKRGGCLTAFLIVVIVGNALTSLVYFFAGTYITALTPGIPYWMVIILGLLALVNIVSAFGVWKWRKWGLYGYGVVTLITFALNLYIGSPIVSSLLGFLGIIILYLLLRPVWNQMD